MKDSMTEIYAAEARFEHSLLTSKIAKILARKLNKIGVDADSIEKIALLHDCGKRYISKDILNKPSKLTADEYKLIQQHVKLGYYEIVKNVQVLLYAALVALEHHERIDGSGYPNNLTNISEYAKIVAVADVFDALISERAYKPAWSEEKVIEYLNDNAGTQFDIEVVKALNETIGEVLQLYRTDKSE